MNWLDDGESEHRQARLSEVMKYVQAGRCVNAVTHDVNNFLGAILAYAELIGMDPGVNDESKRMLTEISGAVQGCTDLVETLTLVTRPKRKSAALCDMGSLVKRVLDLCVYEIRVSKIKLDFQTESSIASIPGDEGALARAILYLLANAVDGLREEKVKHIRVRVDENPDGVRVSIKNSGEAIPESERERIFEPGYSSKNGAHLGLGLSEARAIAEDHAGEVSYDPGEGFILELPRENGLRV